MLSVAGLTKRYAERLALDGLDLALPGAQFVALLGPNGAGKSTLFQLLTGLFAPIAGEIRIAGFDLRRHARAALAQIGVVFQQLSLDLDLSVRRNLQLQADLHGLPRALARERIDEGCSRLGIERELDTAVRALSGGNRRKVELVRAVLHRPGLLLMDEATVGLDPASRAQLLQEVLYARAEQGLGVLWATHLVDEAQRAQRVVVLHQGRLLWDGTGAALCEAQDQRTLEAAFLRLTGGEGERRADPALA